VKIRKYIESALAAAIKKYYSSVKAIVGTSTAGIPHAAFVSQILNLPMAYVRNKTKSHGRSKMIEGDIKPNTPVVVIEDLLSTGNSCLEVVKILRKNRIKVLGVISIFSYQTQKCLTNFKLAKCKCISLCTLDELLLTAIKEKYIKPDKAKLITNFRDSLSY
jgi:orotate phosphoribosyltransferase